MKIWLWILTALLIFTFWGLLNAYERIAGLTEVINQHADAITQHAEILDDNTEKINKIIDYLNEE